MENVLLIGLSRQMALRHQMDVIANNMANVETAGFKGEHLMFEEYLSPTAEIAGMTGNARSLSYVLDNGAFRQFHEGAMVKTDNSLDVAINGKGWFVVQTADGERYTRNGHFRFNEQGQLVTGSGQTVLGSDGPIAISPEETDFTVSTDGTISTNEGIRGTFRIVTFENENLLKKQGNSLYSTSAPALPSENTRLIQGVIERSNVEPVVEMTRMIEVMRSYMSTSRMLETLADLKRRSIQQLGEVPA